MSITQHSIQKLAEISTSVEDIIALTYCVIWALTIHSSIAKPNLYNIWPINLRPNINIENPEGCQPHAMSTGISLQAEHTQYGQ